MNFPNIQNIYKNPIPLSVQNFLNMTDKREKILKKFYQIPPQFAVFEDIISKLPTNHFKGFTWQKNGNSLIEIIENFRELQKQFKEEIKEQIENSVIILDRYENFIKEKTGVKPYFEGFFRFIYVKYGNDKLSFTELTNDDIFFNIVEFCELEKIRLCSLLGSRKDNNLTVKQWALHYAYRQETNEYKNFEGEKMKWLKEIANRHGMSEKNLQTHYNKVQDYSKRKSLKYDDIEPVVNSLSKYPNAQNRAKDELKLLI